MNYFFLQFIFIPFIVRIDPFLLKNINSLKL